MQRTALAQLPASYWPLQPEHSQLDGAVRLCWRSAKAIHTDAPEGHPQPLPRGKSAFKSTLCHPPIPHTVPWWNPGFQDLFRQCSTVTSLSSRPRLFSFLPSLLSQSDVGLSTTHTKAPLAGPRGRLGSTVFQDVLQQVAVLHSPPLPKSQHLARGACTFPQKTKFCYGVLEFVTLK